MDQTAIEKILYRAELLFERNELGMCSRALDEIALHLKDASISKAIADRYKYLCDRLPSDLSIVGVDGVSKCAKCNGTGRYRYSNKPCFACEGKGHLTATDVVRNENYWARRQRLQAEAERQAVLAESWF